MIGKRAGGHEYGTLDESRVLRRLPEKDTSLYKLYGANV